MRRPVPIRMRSRGDCPVLAMSPDPKTSTVKVLYNPFARCLAIGANFGMFGSLPYKFLRAVVGDILPFRSGSKLDVLPAQAKLSRAGRSKLYKLRYLRASVT